MGIFNGTSSALLTMLLMTSCSVLSRGVSKNDLIAFLNSNEVYHVMEVEVINDSFYSVLDTVLIEFEKCEFYKNKLSKMYAFHISSKQISGRMSVNDALGTIQVEAGIESREIFEMYTGAFYYKNRLFVVSIGANTGLSSYPFLQLTGCKLRVVGSDLGGD
ncbi:MAG: hypothetical protein OEW75_14770, partial [Cyclobacteriaceae bacterium]|nr:hypothetical protein [Cyclobacteriaceae bacterium]